MGIDIRRLASVIPAWVSRVYHNCRSEYRCSSSFIMPPKYFTTANFPKELCRKMADSFIRKCDHFSEYECKVSGLGSSLLSAGDDWKTKHMNPPSGLEVSVHCSSGVTSWTHWFMDRMRYLTADTTKPRDWAHFFHPRKSTPKCLESHQIDEAPSWEGRKKTCSCETEINHRSFLDEKEDVFCLHGLFYCSDPPQFGDKTEVFFYLQPLKCNLIVGTDFS